MARTLGSPQHFLQLPVHFPSGGGGRSRALGRDWLHQGPGGTGRPGPLCVLRAEVREAGRLGSTSPRCCRRPSTTLQNFQDKVTVCLHPLPSLVQTMATTLSAASICAPCDVLSPQQLKQSRYNKSQTVAFLGSHPRKWPPVSLGVRATVFITVFTSSPPFPPPESDHAAAAQLGFLLASVPTSGPLHFLSPLLEYFPSRPPLSPRSRSGLY